jgi:predicted AlkP superfamily phosphohydrolase/phosphomutase
LEVFFDKIEQGEGMMQRVFMIGWDGATFDLIRPWIAQGKLPTIAKLLERGVSASLRSTLPPWTFPAWTSFMTGQNPGKHGIFDFFRVRPGRYDLEFVNGGHRRSKSFWQLLSEAGRRVVSISLPCTFPPERVNGIMISGFDFPGEGPGSYVDPRGMYPPELYDELLRNVGPHPIDAAIMKHVNQGRMDVVLERVLETVHKKAATAKYLLQQPWDCFMILFGESDGAGHQFWRYCDPQSPLYTQQPPGLKDSIFRVYQELDNQAAELLSLVPDDVVVMMMSDHGFGGTSDWIIYPNCWLQKAGVIELRAKGKQRGARLRERLKHWGVAHLPAWFQRSLYRFAGGLLGKLEAGARYGMIDWTQTQAYFDENPYFPMIRVNLKGRQPQGTVEPGKQYEDVRDRIIQELEAWRHPETNAPIVTKAYRREEIYSGPFVHEAADIIPKWSYHKGYSYAFRNSSKSPDGRWLQHVDPSSGENSRFYAGKSGTHRDDGIFLATGSNIRTGTILPEGTARIIDLAPTILHILDVPVPASMDGRVLDEIFVKSTPRASTGQPNHSDYGPQNGGNGTYSSEDEDKISERLRALGYVE